MLKLIAIIVGLAIAGGLPVTADAAKVTRTETVTVSTPVGDHVNINTADVKALMTLDGVGRRIAEKIVEYREAHGPFKKPEELRKVDGIGAGLFEKNRERIVVK